MVLSSLITLTTDFGVSDTYVAEMKGVILGINPQAQIIDISHEVAPQDIRGAAFLLGSAYRYFPDGAVHVVVVDPGVGTSRKPVVLDINQACFVAPDNGLLSPVLWAAGVRPSEDTTLASIPSNWHGYELTNASYWRQPVSQTFHGRDIFAPVAAHLTMGVSPEKLGAPIDHIACLPITEVIKEGDATVGEVVHVDAFGNLITNVPASRIQGAESSLVTEIGGRSIRGIARSYGTAPDDLLVIVGGHGYLEISMRNGSAIEVLGVKVGAKALLRGV